jgi:hypothetical protein
MILSTNEAVRRRTESLEQVIHEYFSQPVLAAADDPTGGAAWDHDAFVRGLAAECERAMSQMIADELAEIAANEGDYVAQESLFQAAYTALRPDPTFVLPADS